MASVNKVILVGNLGRDPEVRYSPDGTAICNLSIATTVQWKDKTTGSRKEETEWHRVIMYNRLAEIAGEYLKKGRSVYVEGRLKTRKWQDKTTNQDRYTTEVLADQMQMLGKNELPRKCFSYQRVRATMLFDGAQSCIRSRDKFCEEVAPGLRYEIGEGT